MKKVIIISLIFTTLGLFSLQNCLAVTGNYSFAGVQISAMNYDGIKATIS